MRNVLEKENGFNTRVNLYIILYLYKNMKKANVFMQESDGKRKRMISKDIRTYIPISRQRFERIFQGENYEITAKESETISQLFNISKDYFKKDSELIPIHGITLDNWKCFFVQKYGKTSVAKKIPGSPSDISAQMQLVDKALSDLVKKDYVINNYDTKTAIFRIHYYFDTGATFKEISTISQFLECLELLKISDWKEITRNPSDLKKYLPLLEKHYEYVKAYIKCWEFEKID